MEPQSPPKRMTRARAAAKATTSDSVSASSTSTAAASRAKSTTASSRARTSTATATTASAAAKRKLRTEDVETDNEQDELGLPAPTMQKVVKATRGRPKKAVTAEPEAETTATAPAPAPRPRGRPPTKKAPVPEAAKAEPARPSSRASTTAPAPASTTAARATRAKKTVTLADDAGEEPAKKRATRARATSATVSSAAAASATSSTTTRISVRSASATVASKSATTGIKKKVTFEEPEKENIIPAIGTTKSSKVPTAKAAATETSSTTSAGLKAKPVRRAASTTKAATAASSTTARSRTASGKAASDKPSAPLSPKKVTQMRLARDFDVDSEDELGASDESHLKPFERSPTKPSLASGITPAERNKALTNAGLDLESSTRDVTANIAATTTLAAPDLQAGLLKSPARRPPPSPAKEGLMNSPARRLDGLVPMEGVFASTKKANQNNSDSNGANNKAPSSALFSPAKRFPVHPKAHAAGGPDDTLRSPMKLSLLQTPAKRPASPVKAAILLQRPDMKPSTLSAKADLIASSPEPKSTLVKDKPAMGEIQEEADGDETEEEAEEVDGVEQADVSDGEDADVDDNGDESDGENSNDKTESLTQMLNDMAADAESAMPDSPSRRRFPGRLSAVLPRDADPTLELDVDVDEAAAEDDLPPGEPMDVDESILGAATALVAMSPPKPKAAPSGVFGLRAKDLDDCGNDDDMDSDNDVTTRLPFVSNDEMPATPCPAKTPSGRSARASMGGQSTAKRHKMGKFGFTPLADQLNGWKVRSPAKQAAATPTPAQDEAPKVSPDVSDVSVMPSYFDDAMAVQSATSQNESQNQSHSEITVPSDDKDCAGLMENVVLQQEVETPEFDDDLVVTEEDLDLAQEANEMSLMEPAELADIIHMPQTSDDAMSEASQEYGDENAIPIDPALLAESGASPVAVPPVTPQRVLTRTFHTVSKVPLKPADDSTPTQPSFRRRSMSASRLPTSSRRRSSISAASNSNKAVTASTAGSGNNSPSKGLTRSATVISYSPSKKDGRRESRRDSRRRSRRESFGGPALTLEDALFDSSEDESPDVLNQPEVSVSVTAPSPARSARSTAPSAPVTPAKSNDDADGAWSTAGTPARTPRRDLDPALLRGAVVFVDVHTTEGADASAIFVELLTQMGAQCVKTWSWSPASSLSSSDGKEGNDSSRVGITHVVFKDGSKRTLDKVRESNGVVQCVGVSWVLDCERSNQWQDEAPYYIDTDLMPRGGSSRRRRSMEPEALANINGILVSMSTPAKQTGGPSAAVRECRTAPPPSTPMNRRDSTLWMRTPDDEDEKRRRSSVNGNGNGDYDYNDDQENGNVDAYGEPDWGMAGMLTPVPKTPAPEAIARYAANLVPSSPYGSDGSDYQYGGYDNDDDTLASNQFSQEPLVTRTCPPKQQRSVSYHELGAGILSREKDEGVLMRLMAARRKSLQFAPKIASPLSKAWN